jgi:hypothetical protein
VLKFALKSVKRDMAKVLAYANNNQNNQNQNQNNNQVRMVTSFGQRES